MTDVALSLTTRLKPAKKFSVDGEEYQLLGTDHLSPEDEAEAVALFSRHALLAQEIEVTSNVDQGKAVAARMRKTRLRILTRLTDMPPEVAERLPLSEQVRLLDAIQVEMSEEKDDEEEVEATPPLVKRAPVAAAAPSED